MKRWGWLALLLAGGLGLWAWRGRAAGSPEIPETFRPAQVMRGALAVSVMTTGVVRPQNRLEVKPPIAGRIEEVLVQEGQEVRRGQVLARMSSTERAALLDAAGAKGEEEMRFWEQVYKATSLVAPLEGQVIVRNVEPGQTVTAGDATFVLSDRLIVQAQVDETDIGRVRVGQKASVSLDAYPETALPAVVDRIAYEAQTVNNVTLYEVDVLAQEIPSFFRSGMTANVTFQVEAREDALILLAEAVRQEGDRSRVWVPDPEGKGLRSREVSAGLSDGKRVEILSGLKEGETVLVPQEGWAGLSRKKGQGSPLSPWGRRPSQRR